MVNITRQNIASTTTSTSSIESLIAGAGGLTAYDLVYMSGPETVLPADAAAYLTAKVIGICTENVLAGARTDIVKKGEVENALWGWSVANVDLWLAATGSNLSETIPDAPADVGKFQNTSAYSVSATKIYVDPERSLITEVLTT